MDNVSHPSLDSLLLLIGELGRRMSEINASEGGAGNISVCVRGSLDILGRFPRCETVLLPVGGPPLAGMTVIATGSGRRLREIADDPEGNLGCLVVEADGERAQLHTSPRRRFTRLTSELNSHLAVHHDRLISENVNVHTVVHAQPPHLTYLSHIAAYQDETYLNRRLLRWQPETIIQMPEGLGVVPYLVPGSMDLVSATRVAMEQHQLVIWSRHGVMARSDGSVKHAADLVEYAEAAAHYEYLNLTAGKPTEGLSPDEIRAICEALKVSQKVF